MLTAEISRTFRSGAHVRASFSIDDGSRVTVLFGPSGAGKTTILRCLAGLEPLTQGRILFRNKIWADTSQGIHLPPQSRSIGYLFQDYALFPHLSVRENIGYGMEKTDSSRDRRIVEIAEKLQVEELLKRRPAELSGGQQQRVALARALARDPDLLLLDEPLSALDTPTRGRVREELSRLLRALELPAILVTHDWMDALGLGDYLVVIGAGSVLQTGTPQEVFARPGHADVAAAVGMETILQGTVADRREGSVTLRTGQATIVAADPADGQMEYFICVRGENVTLETGQAVQSSARNHLRGIVKDVLPSGTLWKVAVDVGCDVVALVTRQAIDDLGLVPGKEVFAVFKASAVHLIGRKPVS